MWNGITLSTGCGCEDFIPELIHQSSATSWDKEGYRVARYPEFKGQEPVWIGSGQVPQDDCRPGGRGVLASLDFSILGATLHSKARNGSMRISHLKSPPPSLMSSLMRLSYCPCRGLLVIHGCTQNLLALVGLAQLSSSVANITATRLR